jgi:two-component system OmpR family response regulator
MRALVIEDDENIATLSRRLLEPEGFQVDMARTAREGTTLARTREYDLIMLDMMLPDGSGIEVLGIIRERSTTTPVLVVSGVGDIHATITALDAGADDYLHKPLQGDELSARVRALMRRSQPPEPQKIACGNVTLDRLSRIATVANQKLHLTAKEFGLLEYFIINQGKPLSRKELLEKVWRFDFDPGTNVVDVNVSRLRAKMTAHGATCRLEAERGVGYVFVEH